MGINSAFKGLNKDGPTQGQEPISCNLTPVHY